MSVLPSESGTGLRSGTSFLVRQQKLQSCLRRTVDREWKGRGIVPLALLAVAAARSIRRYDYGKWE